MTPKQRLVAHLEAGHRRLPTNRNFAELSRRHAQDHHQFGGHNHFHDPNHRSDPSRPPGPGNRPRGWTTGEDALPAVQTHLVPPRRHQT